MDTESNTLSPPALLMEPPGGFTHRLLAVGEASDWHSVARGAAAGIGLSALYGAALGARAGGLAIVRHALLVPAGIVALVLLGLPALHILLTLAGARLDALRLGAATARAIAATGVLLGGLAAPVLLLVVSAEGHAAAAFAGGTGLVAAGALGLSRLGRDLEAAARESAPPARALSTLLTVGFSVFAVVLVGRIWWSALPVGGAS